MTKTVTLPGIAVGVLSPMAIRVRLGSCGHSRSAKLCTGRYGPGLDIAPQRNQQLARHGHDGDAPGASGQGSDALAEPFCEIATRLIAKPEPSKLDHRCAGTRVAGTPYATIAVEFAALIGIGVMPT